LDVFTRLKVAVLLLLQDKCVLVPDQGAAINVFIVVAKRFFHPLTFTLAVLVVRKSC